MSEAAADSTATAKALPNEAPRAALRARTLPWWVHAATLLLAAAAFLAWQWPTAMDFKFFLLYDAGGALKADALLAQHLQPTIDFAYSYGLLPLLLGHAWFAAFGRTPLAYEGFTLACTFAIILAMASWARAQRWPIWALALLVLSLPCAIMARYLSQTHALEAALLMWALALHASGKGRRKYALALVTACVFVKPSLAYIYGAILTTLILVDCWRTSRTAPRCPIWPALLRQLAPAALTAIALFTLLLAVYGWTPLQNTLLPLNASRSYRAANFGFFFGSGRAFWLRPQGDYFTSPAAWWLVSTLLTALTAAILLLRSLFPALRPGSSAPATAPPDTRRESFICLAALLITFVCCFYAWDNSWTYYPYLPALGVITALVMLSPKSRANPLPHSSPTSPVPMRPPCLRASVVTLLPAAALAVIVILADFHHPYHDTQPWNKTHSADTAGLWAYSTEQADWQEAHERLTANNQHTLLLANGFSAGLFPGVRTPNAWFMSPALNTPAELDRIRQAIAHADLIVRFNELGRNDPKLDPWNWPEFAAETARFHIDSTTPNDYFTIMVRNRDLP